jgi:chromosomal replication initiator protein
VDAPFKNLNPELNPFVIPGIRNLKIESQLKITVLIISEGDSID